MALVNVKNIIYISITLNLHFFFLFAISTIKIRAAPFIFSYVIFVGFLIKKTSVYIFSVSDVFVDTYIKSPNLAVCQLIFDTG